MPDSKAVSGVPLPMRKRLTRAIDTALSRYRYVEITAVVVHGEVKWIQTKRQQTLEEFEAELELSCA